MQVAGKDIPCGCDERREIMFTQGRPGATEAIIIAVAVVALVVAYRIK